eukprot:2115329-Rhodomonas_salina.1
MDKVQPRQARNRPTEPQLQVEVEGLPGHGQSVAHSRNWASDLTARGSVAEVVAGASAGEGAPRVLAGRQRIAVVRLQDALVIVTHEVLRDEDRVNHMHHAIVGEQVCLRHGEISRGDVVVVVGSSEGRNFDGKVARGDHTPRHVVLEELSKLIRVRRALKAGKHRRVDLGEGGVRRGEHREPRGPSSRAQSLYQAGGSQELHECAVVSAPLSKLDDVAGGRGRQ